MITDSFLMITIISIALIHPVIYFPGKSKKDHATNSLTRDKRSNEEIADTEGVLSVLIFIFVTISCHIQVRISLKLYVQLL